MGEIKSAFEIAMEKVNQMEEATEEEKLQWKYIPEGEKLAGRYLKEKVNLLAELNDYDEEVRKFIINGASGILARNISLPINDYIKQNNLQNKQGLDLAVRHNSLGQFRVSAHMIDNDQSNVALRITAGTPDAHSFFVRNEASLIQSVQNAGVQLGTFKVLGSNELAGMKGEFRDFSDSGKESFGRHDGNNNSANGNQQDKPDSQRRKELWENYRERLGA